jgi:hypothetical protein
MRFIALRNRFDFRLVEHAVALAAGVLVIWACAYPAGYLLGAATSILVRAAWEAIARYAEGWFSKEIS